MTQNKQLEGSHETYRKKEQSNGGNWYPDREQECKGTVPWEQKHCTSSAWAPCRNSSQSLNMPKAQLPGSKPRWGHQTGIAGGLVTCHHTGLQHDQLVLEFGLSSWFLLHLSVSVTALYGLQPGKGWEERGEEGKGRKGRGREERRATKAPSLSCFSASNMSVWQLPVALSPVPCSYMVETGVNSSFHSMFSQSMGLVADSTKG